MRVNGKLEPRRHGGTEEHSAVSSCLRGSISFVTFRLMNQRYYSLDVFRGATVALMILVNNPGSWSHIYSPFEHASWHGLTPTDLVFPFFLFAVGNALAFVMPRYYEKGPKAFWAKVLKRSILIYAIGLFLTWWPFAQFINNHLVFRSWTWIGDDG